MVGLLRVNLKEMMRIQKEIEEFGRVFKHDFSRNKKKDR